MKSNLYRLDMVFFYLGLFFIPFNSFTGISAFGEYKNESAAYFFFLGFLVILYGLSKNRSILFPYKNYLFRILIVFFVWCFLSTLFNGYYVFQNYFKHTSGINRFVRQFFSLMLSGLVFFSFYLNVLKKMSVDEILIKIRRVFLYSLIFVSFYGFFEIQITFFKNTTFLDFFLLFNYFPFLEIVLHGYERISSVSYEPPWLAIYLITIAGWMFSYIITDKGLKRFVPGILILILTFFSGSRTGLAVVSFQAIVFLSIVFSLKKYRKYAMYFLGGIMVISVLLISINGEEVIEEVSKKIETLDFAENLSSNISNKSRFGMQYASIQVFKRNPIIGVGFGQQTYHSRYLYPYWATKNNYEFDFFYQNQSVKSFPPGYNIYTRLLAETGIVGFLIFLLMASLIIYQLKKIIKCSPIENRRILAIILLISFTGFYINWLQIDTFRLYGFWISLAILIILCRKNKNLDKATRFEPDSLSDTKKSRE